MYLRIKHFVVFITIIVFLSCRDRTYQVSEIRATQISIDLPASETDADTLDQFIQPYRKRVNEVLDTPLSYAPYDISARDGRYNSSAGNLLADIIMEQAGPVFKNRTNKEIDFTVLNHGGIRSVISKGPVSARTAYQVMPFENTVVVVEMKGKPIRDLVNHLVRSSRPHPISGIQIVLNEKNQLESVSIQGMPFDENKTYYVATADYLFNGGDDMGFFKSGMNHTELSYLVRNTMIDYFKKTDTLQARVDDRFIKLNTP